MKFAVTLMLGSMIAASAATGARAAELPTRNAQPPAAAKAKTCTVDGAPGIVLPGGNTCVRISGSVSAQVSAGSSPRQQQNAP